MPFHIPVGLNLASIGVSAAWWLQSARHIESAGFRSAWIWDHFVSRGDLTDPVLECWTMLAAASAQTTSIRLGSFVTNVMNRHPAVLARMAATASELSGGRIELGIGAGGHPAEHVAYGIPFPPRAERAEHLDEALSVLRLMFGGGPADLEGRHYRLQGAHAFPAPSPRPRLVVAGTTPVGARLAARRGDAWTCFADEFDALLPEFEAALAAAGRTRTQVPILVSLEFKDVAAGFSDASARWQERGVSELIVHDVRPSQLDTLLLLAGE